MNIVDCSIEFPNTKKMSHKTTWWLLRPPSIPMLITHIQRVCHFITWNNPLKNRRNLKYHQGTIPTVRSQSLGARFSHVTFGSEMVDPDTRRFCFPWLVFRHEKPRRTWCCWTPSPLHPPRRSENKNLPGNLIPQNPSKWMVRNPVFFQVVIFLWKYVTFEKKTWRENSGVWNYNSGHRIVCWVKVIISSICLLEIFQVGHVIQQFLFHLSFPEIWPTWTRLRRGWMFLLIHPVPRRLPNRAHASNIDLRDLLNIAQP